MSGSARTFEGMPVDDGGPVFREPWEAQAFALAVELQEQGVFTRREWAEQLGRAIAEAQARGDPDRGDTYYRHWLAALEALVTAKGLATDRLLDQYRERVREEYRRLHEHDHDHDSGCEHDDGHDRP
jgi:nitrile hydratase accessory protein